MSRPPSQPRAPLPLRAAPNVVLALTLEPDTPSSSMKLQYAGDTLVYAALNGEERAV